MSSNNTEPKVINPVRQALHPKYKHHRIVPIMQYVQLEAAPGQPKPELQEVHLPMVLMTGSEESVVEANTYSDTLNLFKGKAPKKDEPSNWDQQLNAQRAYWTIYMTCRLPTDLQTKYFESKKHVEELYNWDEMDTLMQHYVTVRMSQPQFQDIDLSNPNALQQMIDNIKKYGDDSDFFLNGLITYNAIQLIKFLVSERENYQHINGSSGTL